MPLNKISFPGMATFPGLQPPLTLALSGGEVFVLPSGSGVATGNPGQGGFGAPNQYSGLIGSGQYLVDCGKFCNIQMLDNLLGVWRNLTMPNSGPQFISSDGTNLRVANSTGCPVGAIITNAGSGLTNGFNTVTVTASAGGSLWNTIVGGAINTTVTITAGGTGYTRQPILVFNPPLSQGSTPYILPTAVCTISAGAINAVTVTNQGAGLVAAPTITVLNALGDTVGSGGVLTVNATLVGSGTLLWMQPTFYGTAQTSLPTFTFVPASTIAATAIMNWTVTGFTVTTAGATYPNPQVLPFVLPGLPVGGSAANTNPNYDKSLIFSRPAQGTFTTTATTLTGGTTIIEDPGYGYEAVPPAFFPIVQGVTTQGVLTATVGGQNDYITIQSF